MQLSSFATPAVLFPDAELVEFHRYRIKCQDAVHEQVARPGEVFQHLGGLQGAYHPDDGVQNSVDRAGKVVGRYRAVKNRAVIGGAGEMGEKLARKA